MKHNTLKKIADPISRRTGLDRRWIPSSDHHPERRRGGERREVRQRSISQPLGVSSPQTESDVFPNIDPEPKTIVADESAFQVSTAWKPRHPDATPEIQPTEKE